MCARRPTDLWRSTCSLARTPDAIILDVMMPRLDGLEMARLVRARGDTTPILMLTAHQRAEMIEAALTEPNRLADLAAELVDLASDVHSTDEPIRDIDLGRLANEVADRFRQPAGKELTVSGAAATVRGRRSQLERALGNLVDNAVKWAEARVEIALAGETVTVRDDGPGIPQEDIPHIFQRFYRSGDSRSTPGSGLGLAIVEHLVTAHGGTVFAGNTDNGGAEVGFRLPASVVPDP